MLSENYSRFLEEEERDNRRQSVALLREALRQVKTPQQQETLNRIRDLLQRHLRIERPDPTKPPIYTFITSPPVSESSPDTRSTNTAPISAPQQLQQITQVENVVDNPEPSTSGVSADTDESTIPTAPSPSIQTENTETETYPPRLRLVSSENIFLLIFAFSLLLAIFATSSLPSRNAIESWSLKRKPY